MRSGQPVQSVSAAAPAGTSGANRSTSCAGKARTSRSGRLPTQLSIGRPFACVIRTCSPPATGASSSMSPVIDIWCSIRQCRS